MKAAEVRFPSRSSFLAPIERAIGEQEALLPAGRTVTVQLSPRGYNRRGVVTIEAANSLTFWIDDRLNPDRPGARIKTAAWALHRNGYYGQYEIAHETGTLTIRMVSRSIQPVGPTAPQEPQPPTSNPHDEPALCESLGQGFTWQDLRHADPPDRGGVYLIRIKARGEDIDTILEHSDRILDRLNWPMVSSRMEDRLGRLRRIGACPIVYIGRAGSADGSGQTLKGRYENLRRTHTAMVPLWALVYFGWELEYGWLVAPDPAELEQGFKKRYRQTHGGRLPALVYR